jgi:hypothetical protein
MCGAGVTFSEPALLQSLQSLQNAADWGARVSGGSGSCNQIPGVTCWHNFTVYGQ